MSNFDYYTFRIKNVTDKINEEISFYQSSEYANVHPLNTYLIYLKGRVGLNKQQETTLTQYDGSGNKREIKKMNLDEYAKDMDMMVFSKPWNKLREFHKIMKIKEFVDGLEFGRSASSKKIAENKEYLKEKIIAGLRGKKFGKNKAEIVYDVKELIITSISCLEYNKKTGLYAIDWDA